MPPPPPPVGTQDCLKAMKLPSLLRCGSPRFASHAASCQPHIEEALAHMEVLAADVAEHRKVLADRAAAPPASR